MLKQGGKNRGTPVWVGMTVKELAENFKRPPGNTASFRIMCTLYVLCVWDE